MSKATSLIEGVFALVRLAFDQKPEATTSYLVVAATSKDGKLQVHIDVGGDAKLHEVLAASAYAQHVRPVLQRGELLQRIMTGGSQ